MTLLQTPRGRRNRRMGKTATRPARPTSTRSTRVGLDRDEVVAAALQLVLRDGPAALSMRRLATARDLATPTIYWHVGGRDDRVTGIVRLQAQRLAERPVEGGDARARVAAAAMHLYEGAIEHRAITSLAHQTGTTS